MPSMLHAIRPLVSSEARAKKPELDVVHCAVCGKAVKLKTKGLGEVLPGACTRCGQTPLRARALLAALGLIGDDHNHCPDCETINLVSHLFCFACGRQLASDEALAQLSGPTAGHKPARKR